MKIVVDSHIPFIKGVLEQFAQVFYLPGSAISRKDLIDADGLIVRTRTKCNPSLLEGTGVRFIATATIGYDHIDTQYCREHNIFWTNAEGCNSSSVQQYIAAALLHLAGKLKLELKGKTVGIVGVGNVGKKVASLCETLGMRVLLNDPPRARTEGQSAFVSLESILEHSDIITLHVPFNEAGPDKTFHLVDEDFCLLLKPHQVLLNTSRGEVVDTLAIKNLLKNKKLAACGVDVWEEEPGIDLDHLKLADIGTPHIAGYSADGKANGTSMSVRALSRFFHLGIDEWFPENLPVPEVTTMHLDCWKLTHQQVLENLIRFTYDIVADDRRLRGSPQTFEQQRAEYPVRREFPVYTVRLLNADNAVTSLVRNIGFNIST
jgi:erythronate-4-phosphate dehydrogenase